jgi:glycosyltransferase involved in cell wall biosynthesis
MLTALGGNRLRVIHFSTTHEGGAGLAARRLSKSLYSCGIDSSFYALEQSNYYPDSREFAIKRNLAKKIRSVFFLKIQNMLTSKTLFSTYSSNATSLKFYTEFGPKEDLILHFHNWANLISQQNLQRLVAIGFRVVITLHDQRLLTGGCHYTLECRELEKSCLKCPRANFILQRKIHKVKEESEIFLNSGHKDLRLIAPSRWMTESSAVYSKSGNVKIQHIPNVLGPFWNSQRYSYTSKEKICEVVTVGVASNTHNSYVKASDIVNQLRKESDDNSKSYKMVFLSDHSYRSKHSVFWGEIDYLLALSRADNSPNVIVEAKSLGIPVIASAIGGIPELLDNDSDILVYEKDLNFVFLDTLLSNLKVREFKVPPGEHQRESQRKDAASLSELIALYKGLLPKEE